MRPLTDLACRHAGRRQQRLHADMRGVITPSGSSSPTSPSACVHAEAPCAPLRSPAPAGPPEPTRDDVRHAHACTNAKAVHAGSARAPRASARSQFSRAGGGEHGGRQRRGTAGRGVAHPVQARGRETSRSGGGRNACAILSGILLPYTGRGRMVLVPGVLGRISRSGAPRAGQARATVVERHQFTRYSRELLENTGTQEDIFLSRAADTPASIRASWAGRARGLRGVASFVARPSRTAGRRPGGTGKGDLRGTIAAVGAARRRRRRRRRGAHAYCGWGERRRAGAHFGDLAMPSPALVGGM